MKLTKILSALAIATLLFSSCKKDGDSDDSISFDDSGNVNVGADADGAMYSIVSRTFYDNSGSDYSEDHFATAWFGAATATVNAGVVKANEEELQSLGMGTYDWYFSTNFDEIFTSGNNVTWSATGNSANGVAAFSYVDNTPFPTGVSYTLPAAINVNNSFTLNHTSSGSADAVLYRLIGFDHQVSKSVIGTSTGVTFTSAELKSVAGPGGEPIGFMVMPVVVKTEIIGGKKYCFAKQYQNLRETVTQ